MVRRISYIRCVVLLSVLSATGSMFVMDANAETVEELRLELDGKRKSLKATEEKIKQFQQTVQQKKKEARTLEDQIVLIDENVEVIELTITRTLQEIDATNTEVEATKQDIAIKEQEIEHQKELLAELLRSIHVLDQQSTVAVFLKYETFSQAISETATLEELQGRGQQTLVDIKKLHNELVTKQRELEDFKESLEALKKRQEEQQKTLQAQRDSKERILTLTNQQEAQYRGLLSQAQAAHKAAEAAIHDLDAKIREELKKQGIGNLPSVGQLSWPVNPIFGVSCGFHCAGYPYAYLIGPHSGIDIPTYVGTPIKAPADGYVARTFDSGGSGYSYILLIHGEEISTVFGHVSGFAVNEGQLITRGTIIGYTGGAPGMRGAGLSSGPHLHFEVRKNNMPTNPASYLPGV